MAQVDPDKMELQARLAAIEVLMTYHLAVGLSHMKSAEFDALTSKWASELDAQTFPHLGPVISDAFAAEMRDEVMRLMQQTKEKHQQIRAGLAARGLADPD